MSDGDVSELQFAAFYADCEHEVLPVTHGNRVCLVYNLLQQRAPPSAGKGKTQVPLVAPLYETEAAGAAELLRKAFADSNAPAKIAWLLEHQYSPAGLSFAALKNADRARARVLREAAARADCAIHLGIVHIEEFGPAEYSGYGPRRRRRWRSDDEDPEEEQQFSRLIQHNMRAAPRGCVTLFARLVAEHGAPTLPDWAPALREIAAVVVDGLRAPVERASREENGSPGTARKGEPVDGATLADLLDALATLEAPRLRAAACAAIVADGNPFDPRTVIVPALRTLCDRGGMVIGDAAGERLWLHSADALLAQSEYPPAPPRDWKQDVELSCKCEDCRELQSFAAHPSEQTHRFRVRQDRRQHLHRQIKQHGLDMTHVTERKGSPQTLVCTKTRRTYLRRREEYRQDVAALAALAELVRDSPGMLAPHCARIAAARVRAAASAD